MMKEPLNMTFDSVAELYDAVRPSYPPEMVEAVKSVLDGTPKRILEIGCGTGQATLPFAQQGCRITALEPGQRLAEIAAKNMAAFPLVDIQTVRFEDWPVVEDQFDLVMSATAFHWVSPEARYTKSAQALTDNGWLALFWNNEADDLSALGQQIQAIYDTFMPPNTAHPYATHHPAGRGREQGPKVSRNITRWQEEIEQSPLFGEVRVMQFSWQKWYTTEQYLQLLETYSDHQMLPPANKRGLFDGIEAILARYGGGRTKTYLTMLYLAQKQSGKAADEPHPNPLLKQGEGAGEEPNP